MTRPQPRPGSRRVGQIGAHLGAHLVAAVVIYLPLLLTMPGRVVADTKQYLFLDPITMLGASTSLWDPDWALGTVTHQSVGYLWPMAPWYAAFEMIGSPVWIAQRLWIGSIMFAAAAGMMFLGRLFRWSTSASLAAALFYSLSPYALAYATRISALLMPWAGLPWLIGFAILALAKSDQPGWIRWRDPARLALVATTVGAINASSLIYVGVAVIAWFPYAVYSARTAKPGQAIATMFRIGFALTAASAWWAVALVVQGQWGPDVLRFSETLEVVASGSPSSEAWRGLGYWIFYGGDRTGLWVTAGEGYTQNIALLAATFALSLVSLFALLAARWEHRVYMLGLAAGGLILTVGLYPYDNPSPLGGLVVDGAAESSLALALRSSPRAMPLFLLAAGSSFAIGIDALRAGPLPRKLRSLPLRPDVIAIVAVVALTAAAIPPLWTGNYVGEELARDEQITEPWQDAAEYLNLGDPNERVLVLPGADFSAHRWGNTIDHILPGLIERPVAVRELIPYGSSEAADLLIALDRRAQEGILTPEEVAPIARLLGVGDVIVQSDLEYERYRTPRPDRFWYQLTRPDIGFGAPVGFGQPFANEASPAFPMIDQANFATPVDLGDPPAVATLTVLDPLGVIRTRPSEEATVVVGDGESLVDIAALGLLPPDRVVLTDNTLDEGALDEALLTNATVIITDGNRLRARRWKSIRDNLGFTETGSFDEVESDPTDARLDDSAEGLEAGDLAAKTIAELATADGAPFEVRVSSYGNPISYHNEDRGYSAVDGDRATAWRTATFGEPVGQWLELEWPESLTVGEDATLWLAQPATLNPDRYLTRLLISVDGDPAVPVELDDRSRSAEGQPVAVDVGSDGSLNTIRLTIDGATEGASGVGLAEVQFGPDGFDRATQPTETLRLPISWSERASTIADTSTVAVVVSRDRVELVSPVRDDPQTSIRRRVELPVGRSFELAGEARLNGRASDFVLAELTGGSPVALANRRLVGPATNQASSVFDADLDTVWRPTFGDQTGASLLIPFDRERTIDSITLTVANDERHSLLTEVLITDANADSRILPLEIPASDVPGSVHELTVEFDPMTTTSVTLTVAATEERRSVDWFSALPIVQPVGIAEVQFGNETEVVWPEQPRNATIPTGCQNDLVFIDGESVPVRLSTTEPNVLDQIISVEGCAPITLDAGSHLIETAHRDLGLTIDRMGLVSQGVDFDKSEPVVPSVEVIEPGRGENVVDIDLAGASEPFWLVLGQSFSPGWEASVDGGPGFGPARLVDGFANGWLIDPSQIDESMLDANGHLMIRMTWVPNNTVHVGFWISGISVVLLLGLALQRDRRRDTVPAVAEPRRRLVGLGTHAEVRPALARLALRAALVGVAIGLLTHPLVGLSTAALVLIGGSSRRGRQVLWLVSLGALAVAGAYVTAQQIRYGAPHDGAWPSLWDRAHLLGLVAIGGLVAEWSLTSTEARIS